jgi:hypothetical protein
VQNEIALHFVEFTTGRFFLALEDVIEFPTLKLSKKARVKKYTREINAYIEKNYSSIDNNVTASSLFTRTEHIDKYKESANVIGMSNVDCYNLSASDGSRSSKRGKHSDIFGDNKASEMAHLMPHASSCSKGWIHVVPWVLNLGSHYHNLDNHKKKKNTKKCKILQMLIHGYCVKSVLPTDR